MRQVILYPDHEDGGWVAEVPSLPGCLTQGSSREEAILNARDAIDTWIAGAEQVGLKVPGDALDVQVCIVP
ncbi:MAG: type II toxin-antitoxin system HicB family antitoxin [Pirellulales bacterium]|nr:type II toxin-antitoxin system HicB family antitoxin [Pirellulales bacterium]